MYIWRDFLRFRTTRAKQLLLSIIITTTSIVITMSSFCIKILSLDTASLLQSSGLTVLQNALLSVTFLRSQNTFFFWKWKNTVFLHKTLEKPYLNLHFKFHYFFLPWNNEDVNILSFVFFSWVILKYATTHNHPQVCFVSHFIYCFLVKLIAFVSTKSNSFDVNSDDFCLLKIWIYELLLINANQWSVH